MACPDDQNIDAQSPGVWMKMTITGISKTFPSVQSISTGTLATWHYSLFSCTMSPSHTASRESGNSLAMPTQNPGNSTTMPSGEPGNSTTMPSGEPGNTMTMPSQEPGNSTTMPSQEPGNSTTMPSSTFPQRLIILDTRPMEEFCVGHILGSKQVNVEEDANSIITSVPELEQAGPGTAVVCYCSVGYRSSMVVKKLQQFYQTMGTTNEGPKIYNLEGSIFKWANEGRAMVDTNGRPTRYTHPYNSVFGKLLNKELRKTEI